MVGVWDVDGELITVSVSPQGGLDAVDSSGKPVGAGMVIAGRKVVGDSGADLPA
jgi:hypothetical protein